MKTKMIGAFAAILSLSGCAETSVMQMSQNTFRVQTNAAPACGPTGARNLAYRAAAIEVIRAGGDLYIIESDMSDTGMQGDIFSGMYTNFSQGVVVRLIERNSPDASNALSARSVLGPNWQEVVTEGVPNTCT